MQQPFTGDHSFLKSINQYGILDLIRRSAPISRAELAKTTKLTRATVSALVEELIGLHLVAETGVGKSSGGRRPTLLEINRGAGVMFGLDLRPTDIFLVILNLQGELLAKKKAAYRDPHDPDITREQVEELVESERDRLPETPLGLCGVGIGIHGFVAHDGQILFAPRFGWKRVLWKEALEERWQTPVWIDNEANMAALGELESGAGAAAARYQMLYVSVGSGIGAGLILNGELFRGWHGYAGEVGHTTIERSGILCTCGNRGCWELYASEKALAERLGMPYEPDVTRWIIERLEAGDPDAYRALDDIGNSLAAGIGNLVNTFNPQMVVVGGAIAHYRRWLERMMESTMLSRFPFMQEESVELRYSELGDEACAAGAAIAGIRSMMRR